MTCPCGNAILANTEDCTTPVCYDCGTQIRNEMAGEWYPIETAPKDRLVMVATIKNTVEIVRQVKCVNSDGTFHSWIWEFDEGYSLNNEWEPTHWMPIPKPPKEGK